MDGAPRYGGSTGSGSSVKSHPRTQKPVTGQGKAEQKEPDQDMDDWEFMDGDNNSPHRKKDDLDDGDWECVEDGKAMSDQKRADADFNESALKYSGRPVSMRSWLR